MNLEFSSRPELSITTFILPLDLEPGLDGVTIQNRILMNIQKGVLVHYKVISATEAEGKSTVVYDISNGSEPKPPSKFSSGPWSIGLGVSGNSMSSTNDGLENSNTSASGEIFVNYSTPKVRAAVSSHGTTAGGYLLVYQRPLLSRQNRLRAALCGIR